MGWRARRTHPSRPARHSAPSQAGTPFPSTVRALSTSPQIRGSRQWPHHAAAPPHSHSLRLVPRPFVLPFAVCGGARDSYVRGAGRVVVCGAPSGEVRYSEPVRSAGIHSGCIALIDTNDIPSFRRSTSAARLVLSSAHQTAHVHIEVRVCKRKTESMTNLDVAVSLEVKHGKASVQTYPVRRGRLTCGKIR